MFTGIVKEIGSVRSLEHKKGVCRIRVFAPKTARGLSVGESVAINGACLSAVRVDGRVIGFDVIPETLRLTNLGSLKAGSKVNVEPSLRLNERLGGYLVMGHIDGQGRVSDMEKKLGQMELKISVPGAIRKFLVPKGPITIDGVSMTVEDRPGRLAFKVYLIPETIRRTTLGGLKTRDMVNIEIDYFSKLARQWKGLRS